MRREGDRLRAILVLLLVSSSVLFAIGTAIEHHHHQEGTASVRETTGPTEGSSESGTGESSEETHPATGETGAAETGGKESESLFGFDPEAPWVIAMGVAASVLLALAVWMLRRPGVLVVAIVFGLALAALDLRELVHQVNESRPSLVAVSVVLGVLHLLVAATAGMLLRTPRGAVATA
jgi:hypothetical protein